MNRHAATQLLARRMCLCIGTAVGYMHFIFLLLSPRLLYIPHFIGYSSSGFVNERCGDLTLAFARDRRIYPDSSATGVSCLQSLSSATAP